MRFVNTELTEVEISILHFKSIAISDVNIWIFMNSQFSQISIVIAEIGQNGKLKIKFVI